MSRIPRLPILIAMVTGSLLLAADAQAESVIFNSIGAEQTFVVPAAVTSLHVVAVGGKGADGETEGEPAGAGGFGASVSADLVVDPGATLYVEVGGNGIPSFTGGAAFNGGGSGGTGLNLGFGGGGGGASDLQTVPSAAGPSALGSRLIVASGGGGGGGGGHLGDGGDGGAGYYTAGGVHSEVGEPGEQGEDGGANCESGSNNGCEGGGGQPSEAGFGGFGSCIASGADGGLGMGGAGGRAEEDFQEDRCSSGGGGGGGYYGGGGGGSGGKYSEEGLFNGARGEGGGGGGGSSYWGPGTADVSASVDTSGVPQITLSYTVPTGSGAGNGGGSAGGGGSPGPLPSQPTCRVPDVKGKKLGVAKKKLDRADCKLGAVTKKAGITVRNGKVVKQSPKAGTRRAAGTKIKVTLGSSRS
jgi:hypothetical protein